MNVGTVEQARHTMAKPPLMMVHQAEEGSSHAEGGMPVATHDESNVARWGMFERGHATPMRPTSKARRHG